MSDAFNVPTEIADVTVVNTVLNPVPVTGTIIVVPSGTQDVNIVSSAINVPVNVQNFPAVQTVAISQTGTDNDVDANITNASLAVTGPLTDTQLRATPVPVTIPLPVPVTDNGGSLTVDGTVTALQGTSPWVVSGTIATSPNVNVHDGTGVSISSTGSSLNVDVTNTVPVTGPLTDTQLRATPVPVSGTVAVSNFPAIQTIAISQTGTNNDVEVVNGAGAAAVNIQDGGNSITVDGTVAVSNFPATQPVSGTVTVVQPTGTNLHVVVDSAPTTSVTQGTSPWVVSGTVTANLGTIDGAATEATLATRLADATFTSRINTQGQKTMAASTPVVIASDQSAIAVTSTPAASVTSAVTRVATANTSHQLVASNAARKGLIFYNDSTSQQFIKFGTTASQTDFTLRMSTQDYYELPQPVYSGRIDVLGTNSNGAIQVTELT